MTQYEMFGKFDSASHVWDEGIFTEIFRSFSKDASTKKKWIVMDGPIEHHWVENLNSILDDNKKMSLPNGESINMTQGMCIILETDSL
jgi:hypothetical protein